MVDYKQRTIRLSDKTGIQSALGKIRKLENVVVVNIASRSEDPPLFFSTENMEFVLSKNGDALVLETVSVTEYHKIMLMEMHRVKESSEEIRELLRDHFVDDIKETLNRFLDQFHNIFVLLSCYTLQRPESVIAERSKTLQDLQKQLQASCFKWRDNVRCMDDLRYGVEPALDVISKEMQPRG